MTSLFWIHAVRTDPIRAVSSGSTLFASILKFVSNVGQLFAADNFSRRHFSDAFFLGALRVNRGRSGSVVECLTQDRRAVGLSLTSATALCP